MAQKAATVQLLSEGRFALGLGAGENLNEHVVGMGRPPVQERHGMLAEAIEIIRELWNGTYVTHVGDYFNVHDAHHGPNPEKYVAAIQKFQEAGFDSIALVQAGKDQPGFIRFWERELEAALKRGVSVGRLRQTPSGVPDPLHDQAGQLL